MRFVPKLILVIRSCCREVIKRGHAGFIKNWFEEHGLKVPL